MTRLISADACVGAHTGCARCVLPALLQFGISVTSPGCRNVFPFAQPSLSGLLLLEERASQAVPSHLVHGRSSTFIGVQTVRRYSRERLAMHGWGLTLQAPTISAPQQIGVASKRSPSSVQSLPSFSRNNSAKVMLVFRTVCCLHTTWFAEGRAPWSAQTCRTVTCQAQVTRLERNVLQRSGKHLQAHWSCKSGCKSLDWYFPACPARGKSTSPTKRLRAHSSGRHI